MPGINHLVGLDHPLVCLDPVPAVPAWSDAIHAATEAQAHMSIVGKALAAFAAEPDVAKAVAAFLELTVRASTQKGRPLGCLLACIAMGEAGRSAVVRAFCAQALTGLVALLTERFEQETKAGHLSARPSARTRAQLLADTVQGIALRARAGISRSDLLRDARNYPALILR